MGLTRSIVHAQDYQGFRLTENMNHFMNYFMQGYVVADAETGKLKLRDGADRGFHMICISDACATDTRERHRAALNAFKGYCRTETTKSLLAALPD